MRMQIRSAALENVYDEANTAINNCHGLAKALLDRCVEGFCRELKHGDADHCAGHMQMEYPRCIVASCPYFAEEKNSFCGSHCCQIVGCNRQGVRHGRCLEHMSCQKDGCQCFALEGKPFRSNPVVIAEMWQMVSVLCVRIMSVASRAALLPARAEVPSAFSIFITGQSADKCGVPNCRQSKSTPGNPQTKYCYAHRCSEDDCLRLAEVPNGYCQSHSCTRGDCNNKRASVSSAYCSDHQCMVPGCYAGAISEGWYCDANGHACTANGCLERAISKRGRHARCEDHLVSEERRAAASKVFLEFDDERVRLEAEIERLRRAVDLRDWEDRRRWAGEDEAAQASQEHLEREERQAHEARERRRRMGGSPHRRRTPYPSDYPTDDDEDDVRDDYDGRYEKHPQTYANQNGYGFPEWSARRSYARR
ncbi:hypothetical protein BJ170DRAFT_715087 [Xylariales sp. AK1849]|nr:hypothetical protein BJ170DRAFT_715087 [Xylariales sp. AK1849]